uniref:Uncharacterized protein n=1 Tax=Bos indicus x Bos taurus TaxID=30522 RepID=A0A4W2IB20_BOBOX
AEDRVEIKNADMSEEMQRDWVECAAQALEKYNIKKDITAHIKKDTFLKRSFCDNCYRVLWALGLKR